MAPSDFQECCRCAIALIRAKRQAVALGKIVRLQIEDSNGPQRLGSSSLVNLAEVMTHDMNLVFVMVAAIFAHCPSILTPVRVQPTGLG